MSLSPFERDVLIGIGFVIFGLGIAVTLLFYGLRVTRITRQVKRFPTAPGTVLDSTVVRKSTGALLMCP